MGRLAPRLERVAQYQPVVEELKAVHGRMPESTDILISLAEAKMHVGLGYAWQKDGMPQALAYLEEAKLLAEKAVGLDSNSYRNRGTLAFITLHYGSTLRQAGPTFDTKALAVLQRDLVHYEALSYLNDSFLQSMAISARNNIARIMMRNGMLLMGIGMYADAIHWADRLLASDPLFDRLRRTASSTRTWLVEDVLTALPAVLRIFPSEMRIWLTTWMLDVICFESQMALELQLEREVHLRQIQDRETLEDERHYLGGIFGLFLEASAVRALHRGEFWLPMPPAHLHWPDLSLPADGAPDG